MSPHPCIGCGACCAHFRVSFYWREANPDEHKNAVPAGAWLEAGGAFRVMKGTEGHHSTRCVGLEGRIGKNAQCSMYEKRPSPCRDFQASYEDGVHNERCDQARAHHGLPPLVPEDWKRRGLWRGRSASRGDEMGQAELQGDKNDLVPTIFGSEDPAASPDDRTSKQSTSLPSP